MKRLLSFLLLAAFLSGCMAVLPFDEEEWRRKVEQSSRADLYRRHRTEEGVYFNPWLPAKKSGFLRWVFSRNDMSPLEDQVPPTPLAENSGDYLSLPASSWSVTSVGHATFALHWDRQVIVTDPFFSDRAAVVKRQAPPAFGVDKIPRGSVVVISHNHYDHLDRKSVEGLAGKATFLCPLGLGDYLRGLGAGDVRELDWWQSTEVGGTVFTALPAQHWSRRAGQGYNETLWCSWMIKRGGRTVYFGGDSGYFKGYREFGRRYPDIDVALLPIGAYEPRWFMHYAHLNIDEALRAFEELGAKIMVPTQWGVLALGDDPAGWPAVALREALETTHRGLGPRVRILPVGGRLQLD